jgi:hypothetical protein
MRIRVLLIPLVIAGCGSKPPAAATPAEPDHTAHQHDHAATTPSPATAPTTSPVEPSAPQEDPSARLIAAELTAWDAAGPVFQKFCATCHSSAGKKASKKTLEHFVIDTYPPGGHHTATIGFTVRDVLGISGKKPIMPSGKPGSVKGDDLAKIKAWTDAWEAAEKAGAHPKHEQHEH